MTILSDFRKKYPQYDDMSDIDLAKAMHKKFYSDMPEHEFAVKIGLVTQDQAMAKINPDTMQPEGVPEFKPVGVEGYDPKTGEVNKGLDAAGTFAAAMPEGVPIAGPLLDKAAMSASAGIGSLISGDPYAKVKGEMEGMKAAGNEAHPIAHLGGNIAGAVATLGPIGGTEAGGYALGMKGASLGGRVLRSSLSGGAINATDTLARGGSLGDAGQSGLIGGALGAVLPSVGNAITKGASKVAGAFNKATPRITADTLNANKAAAYDLSEKAGVMVKPSGMKELATKIVKDLTDHGFDPGNEPGAMGALKRIQQNENSNVTLKGLDTIRKVASNGYIAGNKSNNKVISQIINRIDELIDTADPQHFAGLSTKIGTQALKVARQFAHRARKLETVEKFARNGEAIGNSQINQDVEGATRRQVRTLLTNDAKGRGFTPAELKAAEKASSMTTGMRALRATSGLLPQGKLGGMIHGSAALFNAGAGNLPGLGLQALGMAGGYAAKKGEAALSRKAMNVFVDLVSRGGIPAPEVKNAVQRLIEANPDNAHKLLLAAGVNLSRP